MMPAKQIIGLVGLALLLVPGVSLGGTGPPMPMPITRTIEHAEAIVVATIVSYTPDTPPQTKPAMDANDLMPFVIMESFRDPGNYRFKVERAVKGDCAGELEMHLPLISSLYFEGDIKFELPQGARVMLLVKRDENGRWVPADPLLGPVPLAAADENPKGGAEKPKDAVEVMLASLHDAALRPVLTYFVRDMKDGRVLETVRPYADDKNEYVRRDVLTNMAINQDVTAIPKIAAMDRGHTRGTPAPVNALRYYRVPEAVPLLNPIIVSGSDFARMNALESLRELPDRSSIPFLIQCMEKEFRPDDVANDGTVLKDDTQMNVSFGAYSLLCKLAGPAVGPIQDAIGFRRYRMEAIGTVSRWWDAEQAKATTATQPGVKP